MPGVEGNASANYLQDTAASLLEAGYHAIMFNHYNAPGKKHLRMLDFVRPETTDEVLNYAR